MSELLTRKQVEKSGHRKDCSCWPCTLISNLLATMDERDKFRCRTDEAEGTLASACDLLNTWAREAGVIEARNEAEIKGVINRIWNNFASIRFQRDKLKAELAKLRQSVEDGHKDGF